MRWLEPVEAEKPETGVSPLLPPRIGRYQILSELGRGGMGIVYGALDPAIRRTVAIKVVRLDGLAAPGDTAGLRDRFQREARAAGSLHHANIVGIYDVGEQDGSSYIVMELVDGQTLETVLAAGRPGPVEQSLEILRQIASALDYLHTKGIIHRDLKPSNILLDEEGQVKLTDFGIAKVAADANLTGTGMLIGTPHYMSPEQITGRPVTSKADQFALAVLAYQVLGGARPFECEDTLTLVFRIAEGNPEPLSSLRADLPRGLDAVIGRALSKDPLERYASCTEFAAALEQQFRQPAGPVVAAAPVARRPVPKQRSRLATAAGVVIATLAGFFCVLGILYFFFARAERPAEPQARPRVENQTVKPLPAKPRQQRQPSKPSTPAPGASGTLADVQIASEPAGAIAVIDGDAGLTCATPCTLPLAAGRHTVAVSLGGYLPEQRIFEVPAKTTVAVRLESVLGMVTVSSNPAGAQIVVDGKATGSVTPATLKLEAGEHHIDLVKQGFQAFASDVTVRQGQVEILRSDLVPAGQ